ncbi:phospholipase [Kineococcus sp. SYSU DK004]|uniref:phospholipase n=1 Tax=Kineococcus sp. SYSU DK004 TaxID=3383125 RepID=UPI003D7D53F6
MEPFGSHHQEFFVVRHRDTPGRDVALVGSIDVGHSRRDGGAHRGDPQPLTFGRRYGSNPRWHDAHVEVRGPAVRDVETVFRERWEDPAPLSLLPWQAVPDVVRRLRRGRRDTLPPQRPAPDPAGPCTVQLLRTYPRHRPRYPFAPRGEFSVAAGTAKALRRARCLVHVEEQFLWSEEVARVFAGALRAQPGLQLLVLVPRLLERDDPVCAPALLLGQVRTLRLLRAAAPGRVHVYDVESADGHAVHVHSKVLVVDDVRAAVRSDDLDRRSWTHDSELSVAVLDARRDDREPRGPAGLGDGARTFARDLRLRLLREHLDGAAGDGAALLDPRGALDAVARAAAALDAWYDGGRRGPRPPGRLRVHRDPRVPRWQRVLLSPVHRLLLDPGGGAPAAG